MIAGALAVHERAADQLARDGRPRRGGTERSRAAPRRLGDGPAGMSQLHRRRRSVRLRRSGGSRAGAGGGAEQVRAIELRSSTSATRPSAASASSSAARALAVRLRREQALQQPEPQEQERGLRDVGEAVLLDRRELARVVQALDLRAVDADLAGQADQARDRVELARARRAVVGEPVAQIEVALLAVAVADVALAVVPGAAARAWHSERSAITGRSKLRPLYVTSTGRAWPTNREKSSSRPRSRSSAVPAPSAGSPITPEPLQPVPVVEPQTADHDDAVRPRRRERRVATAVPRLGTLPALDIGDRLDVEDQVLGARRTCHGRTLADRRDMRSARRPRSRRAAENALVGAATSAIMPHGRTRPGGSPRAAHDPRSPHRRRRRDGLPSARRRLPPGRPRGLADPHAAPDRGVDRGHDRQVRRHHLHHARDRHLRPRQPARPVRLQQRPAVALRPAHHRVPGVGPPPRPRRFSQVVFQNGDDNESLAPVQSRARSSRASAGRCAATTPCGTSPTPARAPPRPTPTRAGSRRSRASIRRARIVVRMGQDDANVDVYNERNPFDAVSQATPPSGSPTSFTWAVPPALPAGDYVLYVEISREFDHNATYSADGVPGADRHPLRRVRRAVPRPAVDRLQGRRSRSPPAATTATHRELRRLRRSRRRRRRDPPARRHDHHRRPRLRRGPLRADHDGGYRVRVTARPEPDFARPAAPGRAGPRRRHQPLGDDHVHRARRRRPRRQGARLRGPDPRRRGRSPRRTSTIATPVVTSILPEAAGAHPDPRARRPAVRDRLHRRDPRLRRLPQHRPDHDAARSRPPRAAAARSTRASSRPPPTARCWRTTSTCSATSATCMLQDDRARRARRRGLLHVRPGGLRRRRRVRSPARDRPRLPRADRPRRRRLPAVARGTRRSPRYAPGRDSDHTPETGILGLCSFVLRPAPAIM